MEPIKVGLKKWIKFVLHAVFSDKEKIWLESCVFIQKALYLPHPNF